MNRAEDPNHHSGQIDKKRRVRFIVFWALLAVIWLISFFLPEILPFSWHILHGSSIQFQAWKVPVPWGWRVLKGDQGIVIQKYRRGDSPASDVIVTTLGFRARSVDAEQMKKATIKVEVDHGQQLLSVREIQMDGERGFCLTFVSSNTPRDRSVTCDFATHDLSVGYNGPEVDISILDQIIPKISAFR